MDHHDEEDEDGEDVFGSAQEGPSNDGRDSKAGNHKGNAIRSKHSVTEQRRRCKINERFQILRSMIPNADQKRDTASFLLEVIQYVQYLQEKVQKHEWNAEPLKFMPWRNNQWRAPNISGGGAKDDGERCCDDGDQVMMSQRAYEDPRNPSSLDEHRQQVCAAEPNPATTARPYDGNPTWPPVSEERSGEFPGQTGGAFIEGGTISVSSTNSQGLLSSLAQSLETAGVNLSHATISVQINLAKQSLRSATVAPPPPSGSLHDPTRKRPKP